MDCLISLQEDIKCKILKGNVNFKKSPKARLTVEYLETRLENLQQLWETFAKTHTQILSQYKKAEWSNTDYFIKDVYEQVEELYVQCKTEFKELLNAKKDTGSEFSDANTGTKCEAFGNRVKLPEIKIPMFSGQYTEWQTFRDLFVGLVHDNKSLDDAQRDYYLRGHLTGEAEQLLRNIKITSDSYRLAWGKLETVYNNKKFLAKGILKRLMSQKVLARESAKDIRQLLNVTTDCLDAIRNLGVDVSSWDLIIIYISSEKLDTETRKAWEFVISADPTDELPSYKQFSDFLTARFRGLENLEFRPTLERSQKASHSFHVAKGKKQEVCVYCSGDHKITKCKNFVKESNDTRRKFALDKNLCFVCLNNNHSAKMCKNIVRCQVCKRRHHSLLHPAGVSRSSGEFVTVHEEASSDGRSSTKEGTLVSTKEAAQAEGSHGPIVSCLSTGNCRKTVLLSTALVRAESKDGNYRVVRALLDQGSQGSFITEAMAQYLGLKKTATKHVVTGIGGDKSVISKFAVIINIRSRIDPTFEVKVNALVLKSVTSLLPVTKVTKVEWVNLNDDDLADPEYYRPNKIDILLGAEIYSQIINNGIKRNSSGSLLAQDTVFGWMLSGVLEVDNSSMHSHSVTVLHSSCQADDDNMLKKFWELEAEPSVNKILTDEEIKCEKLFAETTKRNSCGRYIVRLPFHESPPGNRFGDSEMIAEKRLKHLESRLSKNNNLKDDYTKVIQEYLQLNHMQKVVGNNENIKECLYLPHHAVVREDRDTTKVRVVFDASCKTTNNVSLNDQLMVGPTLQADLRHTVMRWRSHRICLVADVVKMYRQVLVDRRDTIYQRILWRDDPKSNTEKYELVTVTFGTASAPYLAVRALQQLAEDECQDHPEIAKIILNDFYVDDMMTGAENVQDSFEIYLKITKILLKGGFPLQKWMSNSKELLEQIRDDKRGQEVEFTIKTDNKVKILGLTWNSSEDVFQYSVDLPKLTEPATKRKIISDISRLFDPLGWLAPTIIIAKVLIQKLWLAGVEWDQEVPSNLVAEWDTYRRGLASLANVKIPRWIQTSSANNKTELHGFSDASKMAYAAVVYLRVEDQLGNIHVGLVTAKTKVAPIKQVSIPRLELCGAALLAKLITEVAEVMGIPKSKLHAWTDSEVVLAWLNGHPCRWKTFVANRVSDILSRLDTIHWSHVATKENPADGASRGISPMELGNTAMWFEGPDFLRQRVIEFKKPKHVVTKLEEAKVHAATIEDTFWNKFSSLSKLVRVIAYCRRFLKIRKNATEKHHGRNLTQKEIEDSLSLCIKKGQEEAFAEELKELKATGELKTKKIEIKSLNVFLDSARIIRIGGRLEMSQLDYKRIHPILIPKESFITTLLVADAHYKTMHGGPQIMVTYLRSRYWIVGVKALVKRYVRSCVTCIRYAAKIKTQLMGQLPSSRVTPGKPFLCSGVDYAGPISIRVSRGRGNKSYKGYLALFICMATRAVHLEVVSELSTAGFLAAFKRFVARRGRCAELFSDNGTNFVGAARELLCLYNNEKSDYKPELAEYLATNGTRWHFIPPHAPNFGGLWEAGIKSTKYHLKRVIGNSTLTYEEMATVLAQIEACLNSRPLSYVENSNDLTILTPGHFLVGEPLVLVPDANYEKANAHSLRRWQLQQKMMQDFWRKWSHDYLHQFLQRHKWSTKNPEPSVGDVVLIKEDDMPPGKWLLAKIEQKHPGPDNITRAVTLRVKNSFIKRPTSKLCLLPIAT